MIIPSPPTNTPTCSIPHGRANDPEPMLALAKLKNVAISLRNREGGKEGGRVLETGKKRGWKRFGDREEKRVGESKVEDYLAPCLL